MVIPDPERLGKDLLTTTRFQRWSALSRPYNRSELVYPGHLLRSMFQAFPYCIRNICKRSKSTIGELFKAPDTIKMADKKNLPFCVGSLLSSGNYLIFEIKRGGASFNQTK
jgi:hypothetical protein